MVIFFRAFLLHSKLRFTQNNSEMTHHICLTAIVLVLHPGVIPTSTSTSGNGLVSYLGERGVLCVGNGLHFCTPILVNMSNITFDIPRLSTFVLKKCSKKIHSRLNIVIRG